MTALRKMKRKESSIFCSRIGHSQDSYPNNSHCILHFLNTGNRQGHTLRSKYKVRHRAELGISVVKKYGGLGIGKALLTSCIECAKTAGYSQLELKVVAENERAVSMYERAGFVEYGRNPKGFCSNNRRWVTALISRNAHPKAFFCHIETLSGDL